MHRKYAPNSIFPIIFIVLVPSICPINYKLYNFVASTEIFEILKSLLYANIYQLF